MFMYTDYTQHLLDNVKKIHFIGCGGSGMYPLIQILSAKGYDISGSDVLDGSIIRSEREMGVKVTLGHSADNVVGADLVVYSAAIAKDNVELNAAASYGITTVERSVLLGYVSRLYKQSICVSGTHGKTTTTSMITTALELAEASSWVIRKHFNVVLERTARELRGEPCLDLEEYTPTKQQIICSRSFGHRITQYEEMHQAICAYAERAAEKLRGEHQYCRFISVFLRTSPHADNEIYYGNQASVTLMTPTNDSRDIIRAATEALGRIWLDGYRYMKAGVMLADFFSSGVAQLNLFDDNRLRANSAALMEMMDSLNHSGKGKIWFAGQGIEKSWAMKREMLSPAYTTNWHELPVVR